MVNRRFERLFGGPARKPESKLTQRDMDLARSVQEVTEEIMLRIVRHVHRKTGQKKLCLAGGVALNCVSNGRILREGPFEDVWIQPASGDAGGALGAALFIWYQYLGKTRNINSGKDIQQGSLLGPQFNSDDIMHFLDTRSLRYTILKEEEIPEAIADLIAQQKVIGWFRGRMEFGPRALGSRSILADARSPKMQEVLNLKIKFRESFRPFAASVIKEKVSDYFEMNHESPYMLFVAYVKKGIRTRIRDEHRDLKGLDMLKVARSSIPAVTHVDYSTRLQTVDREADPLFYKVISKFEEKYGNAVIINTSFNVRGEPIVCSPKDAYLCFMRTNMDYLLIGNFLIDKEEQKLLDDNGNWLPEFELD